MQIQRITLRGFPDAAKLLKTYYRAAYSSDEKLRLSLATELCKRWKKAKIGLPVPARAACGDMWYLAQIYALQRHVFADGTPYTFNIQDQVTYYTHPALFPSVPPFDNRIIISRRQLDTFIARFGDSVIRRYGLSADEWRLSPIPYDMLIRKSYNSAENVFIDGYRKREDGLLTSFFGGGSDFGGKQYIDSLWPDTPIVVKPLLVIIPKNYGRPE